VAWYKSPLSEWLRELEEELGRVRRRFYGYLGRPEGVYIAAGVLDAPDPKPLGFEVGNPHTFFMLSADPIALMPFKILGGRVAREGGSAPK